MMMTAVRGVDDDGDERKNVIYIFFILVKTKCNEVTFSCQRDRYGHVITTEWNDTCSDTKFRKYFACSTGTVEINLSTYIPTSFSGHFP